MTESLNRSAAVNLGGFHWTWNALLLPMLFLRNDIPLPVLLARISGSYEINWDLRSVAAIITT
ncbi:carbohydrate ABC transporter permease, partial [Rhizobium leguminosarum]